MERLRLKYTLKSLLADRADVLSPRSTRHGVVPRRDGDHSPRRPPLHKARTRSQQWAASFDERFMPPLRVARRSRLASGLDEGIVRKGDHRVPAHHQ